MRDNIDTKNFRLLSTKIDFWRGMNPGSESKESYTVQ